MRFLNWLWLRLIHWHLEGVSPAGGGGGVTPYHGLYEEAPPERGTFFWIQVYERGGILLVEVYKMVGKSLISVCKKPKRLTEGI